MGRLTRYRVLFPAFIMTVLLSMAISIPVSAQEREESPAETWNIAVFGIYSEGSRSEEQKESLDIAFVAEIDRESYELTIDYIPVSRILDSWQEGQPRQPDLGIRYDDYVVFDWKNIIDGINILGGVDIEINDEELRYINGWVTQTVRDSGVPSTHIKKAGLLHMDGVQAVAYSRLKLSEDDDGQLMKQREILSRAWNSLTKTDIWSLSDIIGYVLEEIETSLDKEEMAFLLKNGGKWVKSLK